jgi:hypothetical protein
MLINSRATALHRHFPSYFYQIKIKVRAKLSLCLTKHQAIKTLGGRGIVPHILDFSTRKWVVSFIPQLLYSRGKSPQYPLDRRLGGPQNQSVHSRKEKNYHPPLEIEPQSSKL